MTPCAIPRDAAGPVEDWLAFASFAGENEVVHSGSSDDTVEIARRRDARPPWRRSVGHGFPGRVAGLVRTVIGSCASLEPRPQPRAPRACGSGR
jgi:hypothetical protein